MEFIVLEEMVARPCVLRNCLLLRNSVLRTFLFPSATHWAEAHCSHIPSPSCSSRRSFGELPDTSRCQSFRYLSALRYSSVRPSSEDGLTECALRAIPILLPLPVGVQGRTTRKRGPTRAPSGCSGSLYGPASSFTSVWGWRTRKRGQPGWARRSSLSSDLWEVLMIRTDTTTDTSSNTDTNTVDLSVEVLPAPGCPECGEDGFYCSEDPHGCLWSICSGCGCVY